MESMTKRQPGKSWICLRGIGELGLVTAVIVLCHLVA